MGRHLRLAWLALLAGLVVTGLQAEADWHTESRGPGLLIESRSLDHGLKEFRAQASGIPAPPHAFLNLLQHPELHGLWMRNTRSVRILAQWGGNENRVRTLFALPWPFQDRELISHSRYSQDPATCIITLQVRAEPEAVPPVPGLVRIRLAQGVWQMRPQGPGRMALLYQGVVDPGGNIPAWISQPMLLAELRHSLPRLRQLLAESRFHLAHRDGIDEDCHPGWSRDH